MKKLYRKLLKKLKNTIVRIEILKTYIFEINAIYKKRNLYKNIKWTKEQQKEFDDYWIKNYGKKISNRWHRLYQSINGVFNIEYIPEILYSTNFEYKLNDYYKAKIFSDKGFYDIIFRNEINDDWRLPKTYLVRYGEIIYDSNRNIITEQEAERIIEMIDECVIKPTIDSSSGNGVKLLKQKEEILYDFLEKEDYRYSILQEKLKQSEELSKLNPTSINTFRVMSYICDNKIEIAPIALRIGSGGSFLDNIHAGGIGIEVNSEGKLAEEAFVLGWGDKNNRINIHPDTKVSFKNYQITNIYKVKNLVKSLHSRFPNINIISWDISLDESNCPVVIEVNLLGQGSWFPQIISGKSLFNNCVEKMLKDLSKR